LTQLADVTPSSERTVRNFSLVRESIESVALEPLHASRLRAPILGIAGDADALTGGETSAHE
jgi:hypothetical protein